MMQRTTVITFLGPTLQAEPTTYCYRPKKGEEIQAKGFIFAQALCKFFEFDRMLVCMTEEEEQEVWNPLQAEGKAPELLNQPVQTLPIAIGNNTTEMWEILTTIAREIETGERVIFDITHGLRSLPFLVFLFAAYLKSAKQVDIQGIYYGALDLTKDQQTPVIDLSEFVEMFDWLTASERFTELGDGNALAQLLRSRAQEDDGALYKAAAGIEALSIGLVLARPMETMKAATNLGPLLSAASEEIDLRAKPFTLLQDQIANAYGQFAFPPEILDEGGVSFVKKIGLTLEQQLRMINWYREKGQVIQAVELAREWSISVFMRHFNVENDRDREAIEQALATIAVLSQGQQADRKNEWVPRLQAMRNYRAIAQFWQQLTQLRNDLAHSGMRSNGMKAKTMQGKLDQIYETLERMIKPLAG